MDKREDKRSRDLERLEKVRRHHQQHLDRQRERMEKRFEQMRERIDSRYGEPTQNQQRIIDTALELLDEDGLNNLSLRKLAGALDMQAPALYWHFKNKEALIDYLAEAILQSEFKELQPRAKDEPWQDWFIETCKRLRKAMKSHRDGARVVAGAHLFPAVTLMKLFEVSMESLASAGIELQRANLIISTAVHFVFGNVIEEQSAPTMDELKTVLFSDLIGDYPLMAKSVQQSYEEALEGYDEFEDALKLIVNEASVE